ncbi:hypothetical protein M8C21_021073, partial [Ambrosia artemisiifolia]
GIETLNLSPKFCEFSSVIFVFFKPSAATSPSYMHHNLLVAHSKKLKKLNVGGLELILNLQTCTNGSAWVGWALQAI